jgi:apolipoprotein D and lipocalin family protein
MKVRTLVAGSAAILVPLILVAMKLRAPVQPLEVVPEVDLARYMGTWYEIARLPNRFEEGCVAARATYNLLQDGKVEVINECRSNGFDGPVKEVRGIAVVVDEKTNAKLKVSFFRPFYGKYWIVELGKDYEYAVVGNPRRNYVWILSRKSDMDEGLYKSILGRLVTRGYDTTRLIRTPQTESP